MDAKKILLFARIVAVLLIVISLAFFLSWEALIREGRQGYDNFETMYLLFNLFQVISVALLITSIALLVQAKEKVSGVAFLVGAAGAMLAMALLENELKIVVWVLAGIAMLMMKKADYKGDSNNIVEKDNSL